MRVLFFGAARDHAGREEAEVTLRAPASAADAFEEILSLYPSLRRFGRSLLFAVNQEYARPDATVRAATSWPSSRPSAAAPKMRARLLGLTSSS